MNSRIARVNKRIFPRGGRCRLGESKNRRFRRGVVRRGIVRSSGFVHLHASRLVFARVRGFLIARVVRDGRNRFRLQDGPPRESRVCHDPDPDCHDPDHLDRHDPDPDRHDF